MELFFADPGQITDTEIILDDFERKHVLHALRKTSGDEVFVTDGCGMLYHAQMIQDKPRIKLKILSSEKKERPLPATALAIGYIRPARLEFVFEKAT